MSVLTKVMIGEEPLPNNTINSIVLNYTMSGELPSGKIIINDGNGELLYRLRFTIGMKISLVISDDAYIEDAPANETHADREFGPFIITNMFHSSESSLLNVGGFYQVEFMHPWIFYQDYTCHALPAQPISADIKALLKNNARGYKFDIDDKLIASTDDNGYNRYKIGVSDLDFIMNTLIPKARIDGLPAYFFINEQGKFILDNYKNLYQKSPKVLIGPPLDDRESGSDQVIQTAQMYGGVEMFFTYTNVNLSIGGKHEKPLIKKFKNQYYFEDAKSHSFVCGTKTPINKMADDSGTLKNTIYPIDAFMVFNMNNTGCTFMSNTEIDDQMGAAVFESRDIDKMFAISIVTTEYVGFDIGIGDVIGLVVKNRMNPKDEKSFDKEHWLNGKWIVESMIHTFSNGSDAVSVINLMRPTLSADSKTSEIENLSMLHTV